MTIKELQDRAIALGNEYRVGSVTPKAIGDLFNDFMTYVYLLQQNLSALGIRKTYSSYEEMAKDLEPAANGFPLKFGQLVAIVSVESDGGKIYSYSNPGWAYIGQVSELTAILSDFEALQNKTSTNETAIKKLLTLLESQSKNIIESVDVSELDSLVAIPIPSNGKADYWLTQTLSGIATIIGRVFLFEDNLKHKVTQVVMSNQRLDDNYPDGSHANEGMTVCYRFYGHSGNDVPLRQWTDWKKMYDSEERLIYKGETVSGSSQSTDVIADVNIQTAANTVQIVSKSWGTNSWNVRATISPATSGAAGVMSNKQCQSLEELGSFLSKLKTAFGTTDLDAIVSKLASVK